MTPTCSNAAMRVLISVLLASTIANAAALPHQVVDARAPAPIQNAEIAAQAIQAAASAAAENPTNFFEDISDQLNNRTAWEVFRDFFTRLFGPRDDSGEEPAEVTVTITASAEVAVSIAQPTSTLQIVLPSIPSTTPVSESEIIFSILPVGDLTSMINVTVPTPVFSTATDSAVATSAAAISAPFPVLNATISTLPTAASISGQFSVIPIVTGVPSPVNSTLPDGTGIALPIGANITIIANATLIANTSTTVIVVTETVIPVPILTTGFASSASAGLPIPVEASPIWLNGTYGKPSILPFPLPTAVTIGTGIVLGTGTAAIPIVPVETALPLGTGIPLVTAPLMTGTGSLVAPTDLASPLYPNTTVSAAILPFPILITGVPPVVVNLTAPTANVTVVAPTASFTQIPILVTGTPDGVLINVTLTPPANETTAAPVNVTPVLTELPITVTGAPGAVLNVSVTIPSGLFANVSATAEVAVSASAAVSVDTGLPVLSIEATAAPFSNTTTTVLATEVVVATPAAVVPSAGTLNFVFPPVGGN